MDYSKPTLIVISGPNGPGKSTHIQKMLPPSFQGILSFDRDKTRGEFENLLKEEGISPVEVLAKATRLMEDKLVRAMQQAIKLKKHFVLETPLSHPDYWRYIDLFENNGYQVQLIYLCLDKIKDCIARVGQRVIEDGHYVDPTTVKGVYQKNLEFINEYRRTFEVIELYDGMIGPVLLARIENNKIINASERAIKKTWIKSGLPSIFNDILSFIQSH